MTKLHIFVALLHRSFILDESAMGSKAAIRLYVLSLSPIGILSRSPLESPVQIPVTCVSGHKMGLRRMFLLTGFRAHAISRKVQAE
jgi:hypothetical protein